MYKPCFDFVDYSKSICDSESNENIEKTESKIIINDDFGIYICNQSNIFMCKQNGMYELIYSPNIIINSNKLMLCSFDILNNDGSVIYCSQHCSDFSGFKNSLSLIASFNLNDKFRIKYTPVNGNIPDNFPIKLYANRIA